MVMEAGEVELRDEIEQEEYQIVFGQCISRRDRLLAALLCVPSAGVLASIVHDLPPAQRILTWKVRGSRILPSARQLVREISEAA
jgi:hypothetical protein